MHMDKCTYTHTHTHMLASTHAHRHTQTHTCACAHTHTHEGRERQIIVLQRGDKTCSKWTFQHVLSPNVPEWQNVQAVHQIWHILSLSATNVTTIKHTKKSAYTCIQNKKYFIHFSQTLPVIHEMDHDIQNQHECLQLKRVMTFRVIFMGGGGGGKLFLIAHIQWCCLAWHGCIFLVLFFCSKLRWGVEGGGRLPSSPQYNVWRHQGKNAVSDVDGRGGTWCARRCDGLSAFLVTLLIGLQGAFLGFDVDKITDIHCHHLSYCPDKDIAERLEVQFTNQPRGTCGAEILHGLPGSSLLGSR